VSTPTVSSSTPSSSSSPSIIVPPFVVVVVVAAAAAAAVAVAVAVESHNLRQQRPLVFSSRVDRFSGGRSRGRAGKEEGARCFGFVHGRNDRMPSSNPDVVPSSSPTKKEVL
jgi:hypothetical protein